MANKRLFHSTTFRFGMGLAFVLLFLCLTVPMILDESPKRKLVSTPKPKFQPRNFSRMLDEDFDRNYSDSFCGKCLLPEVDETWKRHTAKNLTDKKVTDDENGNKTTVPWTGIDDDDADAMFKATDKIGWRFVNRLEWGAKPPKFQSQKKEYPAEYVVLIDNPGEEICNTTEKCIDQVRRSQIQDMETYHLSDIANNFLLGHDGSVYVGRGWMRKGRLPVEHMRKTSKTLYVKSLEEFPGGVVPVKTWEALLPLINFGIEKNKIIKEYSLATTRVHQFEED